MYLLDTNVVSELRRSNKADAKVSAWARSCAAETFYLSLITVLELELGLLLIGRRASLQARVLRDWLDGQLLPEFRRSNPEVATRNVTDFEATGVSVLNPGCDKSAIAKSDRSVIDALCRNPVNPVLTTRRQVSFRIDTKERGMTLNGEQKRLLQWVDAKQPVIGMFHVMTDIKPMIDGGFIERLPAPGSKGKLVITDQGRAALSVH